MQKQKHQSMGAGNMAWHGLGASQTLCNNHVVLFCFPPLQITELVRVEGMEETLILF